VEQGLLTREEVSRWEEEEGGPRDESLLGRLLGQGRLTPEQSRRLEEELTSAEVERLSSAGFSSVPPEAGITGV